VKKEHLIRQRQQNSSSKCDNIKCSSRTIAITTTTTTTRKDEYFDKIFS